MQLTAHGVTLEATLDWPQQPRGIVLFAHGSGSNRLSPRNRLVAEGLHDVGLASLLMNLLTPEEEAADQHSQRWRFDIPFLSERLTGAVDWPINEGLAHPSDPAAPSIGLFGGSTGAAAALITAADRPEAIGAVVSRGGRPDLAAMALTRVRCPTLLIVGGADRQVLALNTVAAAALQAPHRLEVVPGASHLFGEPGALQRVTTLASDWFCQHLSPPRPLCPA